MLSGCVNLTGRADASGGPSRSNSPRCQKSWKWWKTRRKRRAAANSSLPGSRGVYTPIVVAAAVALSIPAAAAPASTLWPLVWPGVDVPGHLLPLRAGYLRAVELLWRHWRGLRAGILIKGGNYLEALAHTETVVFDKTGTLTRGTFVVGKVKPQGMDEKALLQWGGVRRECVQPSDCQEHSGGLWPIGGHLADSIGGGGRGAGHPGRGGWKKRSLRAMPG